MFARVLFNWYPCCFSFISHKRLGKMGSFSVQNKTETDTICLWNSTQSEESLLRLKMFHVCVRFELDFCSLFWPPRKKGSSRPENSRPSKIAVNFTQTSNQGCVKNANTQLLAAKNSSLRVCLILVINLRQKCFQKSTGNCNSLLLLLLHADDDNKKSAAAAQFSSHVGSAFSRALTFKVTRLQKGFALGLGVYHHHVNNKGLQREDKTN